MKEKQKTVSTSKTISGVGLHSGERVNLTINPAPEDFGIVFRRTDVANFDSFIRADYRLVTKTQLGTTLSNEDGTIISTVEHLMAGLWGSGIDNAIIDVDGPEIPIMDGSSKPFVDMVDAAGVVEQDMMRKIIKIVKNIEVRDGDKYVIVSPADNFEINLEIDFETKAISKQKRLFSGDFKGEISNARTFGFAHEVEYMRSIGLARGGSLENAVVIQGDKILNQEGLRYEDEFVRHKLLDCVGDYFLAGRRIIGNFTAYKTGHGLNNKVLHAIFSDRESYQLV